MLVASLLCAGFLSACTGPMPLYSPAAVHPAAYSFSYGKPASRSDQIIYRELRLRLPQARAGDALTVTVASATGTRRIATPNGPYEVVANAKVTVTRADGTVVFSGTRTASAAFTHVGQVLTDKQAETDAAERASVAIAETIRLSVLSALARG